MSQSDKMIDPLYLRFYSFPECSVDQRSGFAYFDPSL